MSQSTIKSPSLDYEVHKLVSTNPRMTRITSQNQTAFTTTSPSTSSGLFELIVPASVINLSKSRLSFQVNLTTATAGIPVLAATAGQYIQRISLATLSGTLLCDVNNFNRFSHMVVPMSTSTEELNNYSQGVGFTDNAGALNTSCVSGSDAAAKLIPFGALQRSDAPFVAAGTATSCTNLIADTARHPTAFNGIRTWVYRNAIGTASIYFDVALGELCKHTLLSLDKMMYFGGESLSLQIYYDAPQNYGFNPTLPTTSLEAGVTLTNQTFTLSSPVLYAYNEMNLDLAKQVMDKFNGEGITIPFSYIYGSKQVFSASTQHTVQQTINSSLGSSLLFFSSSAYDATDSQEGWNSNAITPIIRNAVTAVQLKDYNSFIDSIPISSASGYNCLQGEHYRENSYNFQGACFPLSQVEFSYNWTHVDNFSGMPLHVLGSNGQSMITGMSLGQNRVWSLQANWDSSIAKNWYSYWAVQRTLEIKGGRVSVM